MSNAFAKFYRGHSNSEPGVCWWSLFCGRSWFADLFEQSRKEKRLSNVLPTDGSLALRMITTGMTWHHLLLIFHSIIPWDCDAVWRPSFTSHKYVSKTLWSHVIDAYQCEHYIHDVVCHMIGGIFWMSECIGVPHHMAQWGRQSHGSIFGRTAVCLLEECRCRRGLVVNFSFDAKV